jgi:glycosyltransferase involved in cell wall biosynthesis
MTNSKTTRVMYFATFVSHESGASHALRQTVTRVSAFGIKAFLVIPDSDESRRMFPDTEFEVIYLNMGRPRRTWNLLLHMKYVASLPGILSALNKMIRSRGIQVVHCNEITDFVGGWAARMCRIPCIYHVRHDGIPRLYRTTLALLLHRTAAAIVVPSRSTASWLSSGIVPLKKRVRLIHDYAFDPMKYHSEISGVDLRRDLGVKENELLVLSVSKLILSKGHLCFIKAAAAVRTKLNNVKFAIVGDLVPGHANEANAIKKLAAELTPELLFLGSRTDLPTVYAASDIAVHCPIYPDPYPTVVLLPMLAGKPVIGTRIGGIPEQIEDGRTGILVPPSDPVALAEALIDLRTYPSKRATLGMSGLQNINKQLNTESQGQLMAELYYRVIKERSSRGHEMTGYDVVSAAQPTTNIVD